MDEVAYAVNDARGNGLCTVEGCPKKADSLDHRIPYDADAKPSENPGKTCVRNLHPMCQEHNSSKGNQEYESWSLQLKFAKYLKP